MSNIVEIYGEKAIADSVASILAHKCPRHILGLVGDHELDDSRDDPEMLRIASELNRLAFGEDALEGHQHTALQNYEALMQAFPDSELILE